MVPQPTFGFLVRMNAKGQIQKTRKILRCWANPKAVSAYAMGCRDYLRAAAMSMSKVLLNKVPVA